MSGQVLYKKSVARDLRSLDASMRKEIMSKIGKEFSNLHRAKIKSKKLTGEFKGLYRFRIGNYRVIYAQIPQGILILRISHRKEAYL
ncbi:MAG: type II toxin-antitoxin system RelE/ParE family toxin [Elusimicrobia bacterium]|nr:type II toxin-antitoxin system RelE/ParE family toxin [Elusimicrobiota bacterium]